MALREQMLEEVGTNCRQWNEESEADLQRMQGQLAQEPDLEEAKLHRLMYSISDRRDERLLRKFSICRTSANDLTRYSIGLELYLLYLKQLGILFAIIAGIAIYQMVCNYNGGFLGDGHILNYLNKFSLANQYGIEFRDYPSDSDAKDTISKLKDPIAENYNKI